MVVLAAGTWPTNGELIADVAQLYIDLEQDRVLDPTYGRGNWWTKVRPDYLRTNDIVPGRADRAYDFRHLPEPWADRFDVVAYDPPYIAQGGRATSTAQEFMDRYGLASVPKTSPLLQELINEGTAEMYRVLRPGGLLLVKCMDYINGGRLWYGTGATFEFARSVGFDIVDRFEHVGRPGQQPPGRIQRHARRNLSTLFVLSKGRIWRKRPA